MLKLYSVESAAELLGVKADTIRTWLRDGKIKGTKLAGSTWRITEEEMQQFIAAGQEVATDE